MSPPVVVPVNEDGRTGFRFTCDVCGRRSAIFSLKDSAVVQARSHPKDRCPGVWSPLEAHR